MVTKKTLQDYKFTEMAEYFQLIMNSERNGQASQSIRQFNVLSYKQKDQFCDWLKDNEPDSVVIDWQTILINQLIYGKDADCKK